MKYAMPKEQPTTERFTDAELHFDTDNPTAIPALSAYLRQILGAFDIGGINIEMDLQMENLTEHQLRALNGIAASGWAFSVTETQVVEHTRFPDGTWKFQDVLQLRGEPRPTRVYDPDGNETLEAPAN